MEIERQAYLDYLARCHQAFRPFAPIELPEFFKGRHDQVNALVSELQTPGRHVAVFGERGVGKTSLAALACFFADFSDDSTYVVRCQTDSTYDTIFGLFLTQAGHGYLPRG